MLRGLYKDPERYQEVYWSRFKGMYFAPATGPGWTRTATSGSWAGWTMS